MAHLNLISIIVPVYNGEKYIQNLIEHLLKNPYENLEILIGDDSSKDGTRNILKSYENHPRIKIYLSDKNIGAGAMRNKLLGLSTGHYIAIQDMDDLFDPSRFIKQADFLDKHQEIGVVGSNARLIGKTGSWGNITTPERPVFKNWFLQNSIVHASIMLRRSILSQETLYAEGMRFGEDYYFLTKLYMQGVSFFNLQENLYDYYITRSELKSRAKRFFGMLVKSKCEIAKILPWYIRPFFVTLHTFKLAASAFLFSIRQNNE